MKKVILITTLLAGLGLSSVAQENGFHLGGRFGLGESTISSGGLPSMQPKLAMAGGLVANYQVTDNIGFNADFLLSSTGAKASGSTREPGVFGAETYYSYKERYSLINVEVPFTGQLSVWMGDFFVRGYAGPGLNFNLMSTQTREYDNADYNASHGFMNRQIDTKNVWGMMVYGAGIGARTREERTYFLDFRLNRAFSSFGMINGSSAFSHYYSITGGYVF